MIRLASVDGIAQENVQRVRSIAKSLEGVSAIRLGKHHFQQVQIRRHNAFYGFLMNVCELIYDATLPDQNGEGYRFKDILRDERKMALVFQAFVRNFLRMEQSKYEVGAIKLEWDAQGDPSSLDLLPSMITDILLSNQAEKIIVDTKYYSDTMQESYEKRTLHSDNLYQLFSYLKNSERRGPDFAKSKGVLLYPSVNEGLDVNVVLQGHEVRAFTLNLNQPWQSVRRDLLAAFL